MPTVPFAGLLLVKAAPTKILPMDGSAASWWGDTWQNATEQAKSRSETEVLQRYIGSSLPSLAFKLGEESLEKDLYRGNRSFR
jgi:hypothetical protein